MALILKDRVQETSVTTGTGTLTLAGAVTQFQTFSSAVGNGNTTYYTIYNAGGSLWEVGLGTVGAGTLSRDTVLASSNSNALVSFTGTLYVFGDYPAGKSVYLDAIGTATVSQLATSSTTNTTPVLSYNASNSNYAAGATVSGSYLQTVMQNKSGTAGASTNYVLSNDLGTDSTYYGEFGMNSSVYSAGTPADFFSLNNGIYYSGHDGDVTIGSGNGKKTYLAWGTTGQSAHVINATGSIGLNTDITGTNNYGTAGQVLTSQGNASTPTWTTPTTGTVTSVTGTAPVVSSGGATPAISMAAANTTTNGYLTSTDWNTFNGKGSGTVTSVAATVPSVLSISGSPITTSGTLAITYSGTALPAANGGTGLTSVGTTGNVLTSNGTGWVSSAPSANSPAGSTGQLQYNNSGAFGGLSSGTNGQTLVSSGSSSNPAFSANLVVASNIVDASANTGAFYPPIGTTAQRPSSPTNGAMRYNTTLKVYEVYGSVVGWTPLLTNVITYTASYLMVAGGGAAGGGAAGGGGGAGGLLTGTTTLIAGSVYTITVGAGGTGVSVATGGNGSNSSITGLTTAIGGGGGAAGTATSSASSGGSGGGGQYFTGYELGASGTSGQGNAGGRGYNFSIGSGTGGGGGAGAVGGNSATNDPGPSGSGGVGITSSITGSSIYYAGGGGGGAYNSASDVAGSGGTGGGGNGGQAGAAGTAGTTNTGGGGGGTSASLGAGANGGSGVVILSVPTASYSGTTSGSPTVTTSGSNTIIKFTASGSYTA